MHVKTGIKGGMNEIECIGDHLIQIFIPEDIKSAIEKVFESTKALDDINSLNMIENVLEKKTEVQIIINKSPQLAEDVRKQIMQHFK